MRRLAPAVLLLAAACSHPLPAAPPHARVEPKAAPPADLTVCWLEYQRYSAPAAPVTKGPTDAKKVDGTMSGILVRHPNGDLLIDAGNSSRIKEEVARLGFVDRQKVKTAAMRGTVLATSIEAVKSAGADPAALKAVVASHAHLDHLGGLVDLPTVPVWMPQEEIDFVKKETGGRVVFGEHAKAVEGRVVPMPFAAAPYQTFDESWDVFGDGTIVIVKLAGHTPGSIGTFVNFAGKRIFHVGDAVWLGEQIEKRAPKGFLVREADDDYDKTNSVISRLAQLQEMDPDLVILPAHDRTRWVKAFGAPGCPRAGSQD